MHAVTDTQSKKGNGLGMANVMYDKIFFYLFFLFIYMLFFFFVVLSRQTFLLFYFTEFGPHLVFVFHTKIKDNSFS